MKPPVTKLQQPPFPLPSYVLQALNTICSAGYEAYLAGGCVRDLLLGRIPDDYDITTSATPQQVMALFDVVVPTGLAFGGVTVVLPGGIIEVTTYRSEAGYSDGRHPDAIYRASSLVEDVARRDFTVNALCYHPKTGVVDYINGMQDLKNGIIRAVGDPQKRFDEDVLRVMRAVRFSAQLGFIVEEETLTALRNSAYRLVQVSAERRQKELYKLLLSPCPHKLELLRGSGALPALLGCEPLQAVSFLPLDKTQPIPAQRYGALAILCGIDVLAWAKLLKFSNQLRRAVFSSVTVFTALNKKSDAVWLKNMMAAQGIEAVSNALAIASVLWQERDFLKQLQMLMQRILQNQEPYRIADLALGGLQLAAWGVPPSLRGQVLEYLRQAVVDNAAANTSKNLEKLALKYLDENKISL